MYARHSPRLFRTILRLVKSEERVEDLTQDVFVKVWENRANLDPDRSLRAYLFKLAENQALDFFRKVARDRTLMEQMVVLITHLHDRIEESLLHKEYESLANHAIDLLPPHRRRIFQLCRLEGLSYEKVGEGLRISPSTVSDHMVKAIKFIKEYLRTHGDIVFLLTLWWRVARGRE